LIRPKNEWGHTQKRFGGGKTIPVWKSTQKALFLRQGDKPEIRREMSEIANDWTESGRYEKAVPQYKYVVELPYQHLAKKLVLGR